MEFTFYKDELLRALKLLEPYAGHEQTELDSEPYFDDKVVFAFGNKSCRLSVCHDDMQIHIDIPYYYGESDLTFCMELVNLIKVLKHTSAQLLRFEEDTFFGFFVYSVWQEKKKYLYELKAYSARKIKGYKVSNSSWLCIRKNIFLSLLSSLYEYTRGDCLEPIRKYIWFYGNGKEYTAIATDGHKLAYRRGETYIEMSFSFAILGEEVPCLLETLHNVGETLYVHMEYEYNIVYGYDKITGTEINILHFLPDVSKWKNLPRFLQSLKCECVNTAIVLRQEIITSVRRINETGYDAEVFLHFINGHVNIHSYDEDFEEVSLSEFYKTLYKSDDFITRQKASTLLLLLESTTTTLIQMCIDSRGFLHVINDDESIYGFNGQFSCGCPIGDNEKNVIERKDFELARDNEYYRKSYFK